MLKIKQYKTKQKFFFSDLIRGRVYLGTNKALWDPKISPYLLGIRNGFCIFKLKKTLNYLRRAVKIISKIHHSKKKNSFYWISNI
jgi:ribosomal protein S2